MTATIHPLPVIPSRRPARTPEHRAVSAPDLPASRQDAVIRAALEHLEQGGHLQAAWLTELASPSWPA